jgi:hypothetical protein
MEIRLSQAIERPPADVFRFLVTDHVQNHPRWDPHMSLEQVTPGPLGVGSVIRRSYLQGDTRVDGEMEVVELEPDRAMGVVIRDGPAEMRSRMTVEPQGAAGTLLTLSVEADVPVGRMDPGPVQQSIDRMKELIEQET